MGWGCYKHEWDANSECWNEALKSLCESRLASHGDWGRDTAICPKCWAELEDQRTELLEALKAMVVMSDRGSKPRKLEAALSWIENDRIARTMADTAIAKNDMFESTEETSP